MTKIFAFIVGSLMLSCDTVECYSYTWLNTTTGKHFRTSAKDFVLFCSVKLAYSAKIGYTVLKLGISLKLS